MNRSSSRQESDFLGARSIPAAACDDLIAGRLHEQFVVDAIQGGAGTSPNMNANEVIATVVSAANTPLIGYGKAALVAKTALANRATIADTAHALAVMSAADVQALLVPQRLTRPMRLEE